MAAIDASSLASSDDVWEQHQAGPESGLARSSWRTVLTRPLIHS
jgi:hypothetical protein